MKSIQMIFDKLDKWRNLPDYQLERRADIFFSLYLCDVLSKNTGQDINPTLIPEFPLKRENNNGSCKVDYLAFNTDLTRSYLIEIKTDFASLKIEQLQTYLNARADGIHKKMEDIFFDIYKATKEKRKYQHLIKLVEQVSLGIEPDKNDKFLSYRCEAIKKFAKTGKPEIYLVIPSLPTNNTLSKKVRELIKFIDRNKIMIKCIDFAEYRETVLSFNDELSQTFADSLSEWYQVKAGTK
jgi:hypothetical protein